MSEPKFGPYVARIVEVGEAAPELVVREDMRDTRFQPPPNHTIRFDGVVLERVDFSGARFDLWLRIRDSVLIDCDFSRAKFARHNCGFDDALQSTVIGCRFDSASMRDFQIGRTRFERCSFNGTKISGWRSHCAEFVDCTFACRIENTIFYGRPEKCYEMHDEGKVARRRYGLSPYETLEEADRESPRRPANEFRGNDFSGADLRQPDFRKGIDLTQQRWPTGPGYLLLDRFQERLARVRADVEQWPESSERANTLHLLRVYGEGDGNEEQTHHLFTPYDRGGWYGRAGEGDRLRAMLEAA